MKITRTYEVWTGGDMVEDFINDKNYAIQLAKEQLAEYPNTDVVVDEIIHYIIFKENDIKQLEKEL